MSSISVREIEQMMETYSKQTQKWMLGFQPTVIDYISGLNVYSPRETNAKLTYRRDELNREIEAYRRLIE